MKHLKRIGIIFLALLVLCGGAIGIYAANYYHMDESAVTAMESSDTVTVTNEKGLAVFTPENPEIGLIFYPGGKVECAAYQPLMAACAQQGILCILVEMPFNLAVLDINAADGIQAQYPEIEKWYIGGHSLGGSMAASYLAEHIDDYEGLILLGSYSTADLSETDLDVLSVYGSEDQVMNRDKYEQNKSNLPGDFTEVVIEGGCHAYFGMYGAQEEDGKPGISNVQQIFLTAEQIFKAME